MRVGPAGKSGPPPANILLLPFIVYPCFPVLSVGIIRDAMIITLHGAAPLCGGNRTAAHGLDYAMTEAVVWACS